MYSNRTLTGSGLFYLHIDLHHYDDLSVHTSFLRYYSKLCFTVRAVFRYESLFQLQNGQSINAYTG